jgi:hypothetical protein
MIYPEQERGCKLEPQKVYDVVAMTVDAANDEGFINPYILDRALVEFFVTAISDDLNDKYFERLARGEINGVWKDMLKDDTVFSTLDDESASFEFVCNVASDWCDAYKEYLSSPACVVNAIQKITSDMSNAMNGTINNALTDENINEVMKIATDWGMLNDVTPKKEVSKPKETPQPKKVTKRRSKASGAVKKPTIEIVDDHQ